MVGQNVGKYRVLDRIGRGGMGTVYRAMDEMLHRDVAIKVLNAELNDPEVAKRFRAEAITVARLSHPGIATIYELFEYQGQWLMVMEFVRGETLENMVARMGPLSAQRSAELCMQALAALAHAHSMGVVHRDLKPANLMITENGSVKVMDFGIARVSGSEHLTNAGFMMGTPAYMAPEQVRGGEVDSRADLYAMGVVFYRLTTAKLPFKGDTAFAMVQSQVNEPPTPVRTFRPELPPWVEEVMTRALAKAPEHRFQSAAEFHEALARSLAGLPLSSMYAVGETMMTPSRAMPSGGFTRPMPTPSAAYPAYMTPPMTAAPGTNPAMISGATDPTMAAPSGATQIPPPPAPSAAAGPVVPAVPAPARKAIPVMWIGLASVVVLAIAVAAVMMFKGGGVAEPPAASPTPITASTPAPDTTGSVPVGEGGGQGVTSATQTPQPGTTPGVTPRGTGSPAGGGVVAGSPTPTPGRAGATPTPTPTPGARAAGPGATPVAPPIPDADAPAEFRDVKFLQVTGRRASDRDAVLNFGGGQLLVMPKSGGAAIATLPYKRITRATYTRARDPKWDRTLASPPEDLDVGSFIRTARHWLVLQGPDHYEILRLDDANLKQVLDAFEARTGIKIVRQ